MSIQFDIESQKARQVPLLGVDGALGLARHLRAEILLGECC
jgi:hypothetical protein